MTRDAMPTSWLAPMLATLGDEPVVPAGWVCEPKWDGVRCLAVLHPRRGVTLWSRNRKDLTVTFAEIAEALAERAEGFGVLDGEVIAGDPAVQGDFGLLQGRLGIDSASRARATGIAISYQVFDVLWWDGADQRARPWHARREVVMRALRFGGPVQLTPAWSRGCAQRLLATCASGGEGLVGKRPDAPYQSTRSRDWLKVKCTRIADFVVGGWTAPAGTRTGFGSLLVGTWEDGELRYAGRVGTGFTEADLARTTAKLEQLELPRPPFAKPPRHDARWVEPVLVARVGYTEWTRDRRLRHPRFLGWSTAAKGGAPPRPPGYQSAATGNGGRARPGRTDEGRRPMPRGDKSAYTGRQKRKATHIEQGYERRGVGRKEAERRAWATVNKQEGGGKRTGSGRKGGTKRSSR